jgi:XTP/dITP diphosphohydrolase
MDLLLATRNAHKTREFADLLGSEFTVSDLASRTDVPTIEETGSTFAENAQLKALAVSRYSAELVVADDSGLEVDALNGAPGVFSARYAGANAVDADNVRKLLRELRGSTPGSARFRCALAIAQGGKLICTFEAAVEGQVIDAPRGTNGFGYDPVFVPAGFTETFAELPLNVKNSVSHRARAVAQLAEFLQSQR